MSAPAALIRTNNAPSSAGSDTNGNEHSIKLNRVPGPPAETRKVSLTAPITRRQLLQGMAVALPTYAAHQLLGGRAPGLLPQNSAPDLFELIPPSTSGITWRHVNGRSPDYYLPETTGAGCAFLDYDNDGWMDIYLVNSGIAISTNPTRRCGTRSIATIATALSPTSPTRPAWRAGGYGMGVAVGDYDGDGFPDHLRHPIRTQHPLSQ